MKARASQAKPRRRRGEDFNEEWLGRLVTLLLSNGREIRGMVVDATRYWLKLMDNQKNTYYINKSYIVQVIPHQQQNISV
jgi:RNase P/RNase MRP subunit p29